MKKLLNIILIILLSISILIVSFSMTIVNNSFVKLSLTIHNYYEEVTNNINKDIKDNYMVNVNDVKSDINNYISNYYEDKTYTSNIEVSDDYRDEFISIYNNYIKFYKPNKNIKIYHDIVDYIVIVIICIIGFIFIKTKNKHTLDLILIISSIIGIIMSGIIYIFNNFTGIVLTVFNDSCYVYLGINLLLLSIIMFRKVFKKHKIICK